MRLAHLFIITSLLALTLSAAAQGRGDAVASPAPIRRLYAIVHTRDDRGRVFCALWRGREGYPTDRRRAASTAIDRTVENRQAICLFEDVTPGEYALAAFHDENANNDLDVNFLGIPQEGTGASNDAYRTFGPPAYDDARFILPDIDRYRIDVHIRY